MIYELLYPLSTRFGWASVLNVLRYMPFRIIMATITAMVICFLLAPWFIRRLQSKQIGQIIRDEGPQSHRKKAGTPTMGGALILLALLVSTVLWADLHNVFVLATAAVTAGYGVIGYIDDRLKIVAKNSRGLPGRYKLLGQFGIGGLGLVYTFVDVGNLPADWIDIRTRLAIPFVAFAKYPVELPIWLYLAFALFVLVALQQRREPHRRPRRARHRPGDDQRGHLPHLVVRRGPGLVRATARAVPRHPGTSAAWASSSIFCGAMIGAGIGFLWYNTYPAQVFMGDVGLARARRRPRHAGRPDQERAAQRPARRHLRASRPSASSRRCSSFKLFGKRVFLMAPIHHHFEKKGWPEPKIIVRFWIISIMLALSACPR